MCSRLGNASHGLCQQWLLSQQATHDRTSTVVLVQQNSESNTHTHHNKYCTGCMGTDCKSLVCRSNQPNLLSSSSQSLKFCDSGPQRCTTLAEQGHNKEMDT
eukprot:3823447-Amphidinium_carterae.1